MDLSSTFTYSGATFFNILSRSVGLLVLLPVSTSSGGGKAARFCLGSTMGIFSFVLLEGKGRGGYASIPLEFLVGVLLSLPFALMVHGAGLAGQYIEAARGQLQGELVSPLSAERFNACAELLRSFTWSRLLLYGGGIILVRAFVESLILFPVGEMQGEYVTDFVKHSFQYVEHILRLILYLVAPFAVGYLLIDISGLILCKVMQGIPFQNELFLAKFVLTVLLFFLYTSKHVDEQLMQRFFSEMW